MLTKSFVCVDESMKRFRSRMAHEQVHMNSVTTPLKRSEQNKIPIRQVDTPCCVVRRSCSKHSRRIEKFFVESSIKVLIARQANNRLSVVRSFDD